MKKIEDGKLTLKEFLNLKPTPNKGFSRYAIPMSPYAVAMINSMIAFEQKEKEGV